MRHHDEGHPGAFLNAHQLELGVLAQLLVQRGQRLVQQQKLGLTRQRPGQRHPLALTARNLVRLARGERRQLHQIEHGAHPLGARRCGHPFVLQPIAHVPFHRHVRKQRVALKHHVHRAIPGRHPTHVLPVDEDAPAGRSLEPRQHPQQGGLAAARPAQQAEDFTLGDGQGNVPDRRKAAKAFRHALKPDEVGGCPVGHRIIRP